MKYFSTIFLTLLLSSFTAFSQEISETEEQETTPAVAFSDSFSKTITRQQAQIDSLKKENDALLILLKKSMDDINTKESEIAYHKRRVTDTENSALNARKRHEAEMDALHRKLISLASNFLYIPYDEYSINEIAVPAFAACEGSSAYATYKNRLPMLTNYKDDILSLINFISLTVADLTSEFNLDFMKEEKAKNRLAELKQTPVYLRYAAYEDWENTYLGGYILQIEKELKTPKNVNIESLKDIQKQLESVISEE